MATTQINVTSLAVEAIREVKTRIRVTSLAVEVLRKTSLPRVRTTGFALEVIRTGVKFPKAQIVIATGD